MRNLKSMRLNQDGTTAVEFAMVAPVFILLVIGTIGLCFALFLVGSLHFAVEDGARCASVKTTICADAASTIAYTRSRYLGPNVSPTFTYTSAACGNSVSASVSYSMDVGFKTFVVPISATACFP
ncbi:TadE/TadG family type IV pilus assembly protein [Bradyrhizobium sp. DASA03120]|uniref:TadE/TadG family type IV pilus assembly protein n=1 Tax=Bradyrhizobium sp. SMVTL-02 TaxID=3395917 RepID=UPI003F71AE7B